MAEYIILAFQVRNLFCVLPLKQRDKNSGPPVQEVRNHGGLKTLRHLVIKTDQDQDAKTVPTKTGLLVNLLHHNLPSLLRLLFIEEFHHAHRRWL